ncbi:DUF4166 domain-containing protein [[Actinomadura] parvosata]|uniref:DUF4166 domain-containing protein n=1 Tax=[Actinomadura] parvosata TaxID=1955412 RepID=UPI00406C704E
MRLYIEILIRADMEALWQATQDPALHTRWDLRVGRGVMDRVWNAGPLVRPFLFVRTFPRGRFDVTVIYDPAGARVVDYLDTHQHLATPLTLSVDDRADRFRIAVTVSNPLLGRVFGYWGSFTVSYVDVAAHGVPASVRPRREAARL